MKLQRRPTAWLLFYLALALLPPLSLAQVAGQRSSHTAFSQPLPALHGDTLTVEGIEVTYGPGAASPPHSHSCPAIGYVLSGVIRTQIKGQPEAVYKAGESFYEPPNGVHLVSANASDDAPAKLLALFVCDHKTELTAPAQAGHP
jgi:quercetin dioxygenase-like cupin family protein